MKQGKVGNVYIIRQKRVRPINKNQTKDRSQLRPYVVIEKVGSNVLVVPLTTQEHPYLTFKVDTNNKGEQHLKMGSIYTIPTNTKRITATHNGKSTKVNYKQLKHYKELHCQK